MQKFTKKLLVHGVRFTVSIDLDLADHNKLNIKNIPNSYEDVSKKYFGFPRKNNPLYVSNIRIMKNRCNIGLKKSELPLIFIEKIVDRGNFWSNTGNVFVGESDSGIVIQIFPSEGYEIYCWVVKLNGSVTGFGISDIP